VLTPLQRLLQESELEAHKAFIEGMGDNAIWSKYNG
jgi:DNA polymerase-3 subunit epsilon